MRSNRMFYEYNQNNPLGLKRETDINWLWSQATGDQKESHSGSRIYQECECYLQVNNDRNPLEPLLNAIQRAAEADF